MKNASYRMRFEEWLSKPSGAIICSIIGISAADAVRRAWGSRDFLTEFLLWWVAGIAYIPLIFAPFAGGIYMGIKVAKRTGMKWTGWLAGIAVTAIAIGALSIAVQTIPGIGWRLDAFLSSGGE